MHGTSNVIKEVDAKYVRLQILFNLLVNKFKNLKHNNTRCD